MARILRPQPQAPQYILNSDASNIGWGATLICHEKEVNTCAFQWTTQQHKMHITQKEALASALALHHLIPEIPQGSKILLQTDATSTAISWTKGSKNYKLNQPILESLKEATAKNIHIQAKHLPGHLNTRADYLSRNTDPKNYHLDKAIFHKVCTHFDNYPEIDLFANRYNKQTKKFCSWRADRLSEGNAFQTTRKNLSWLNPPWELIPQCLRKLRTDRARVLFCLPHWATAHWWRDLLSMLQTKLLIVKGQPLYKNPQGEPLPPPRWATCFGILQG
jgi:hypothetical protein